MVKNQATPQARFRVAAVGLILAIVTAITFALVSSPPAGAAVAAASTGWLHTSGSRILDDQNKDFRIKAVNWFGLETSNCAPHGLWQISLDSGMAQIASFGFNTIRLPYSNGCVNGTLANSIDTGKNPTLADKTGLQVMDAVIASAKSHGLKIILDRHRPDTGSQSELWYTSAVSEQQWIADWKMLATRYAADSTVIGADLHNEPRGTACWGCGDATRDWAAAAVRGGNAVLAANPKLLILVEGVELQSTGGSTWWGGGLGDVAAHPISLAVAGRLVYAPHDYPASIYAQSWFAAANYPANLPSVWDRNWGHLQKNGIAPVLLGEFGSKLETSSDQKWLTALVSYLNTNNMSFAYWSFNPNSGDTGGLVKDDWVTPQTAKLQALAPLLTGTASPTSSGTPTSSTSTSTSTSTPTSTSTTAPTTTTTPTTTAPTTSTPPTTTPPTTTPAPVPGKIKATWSLQSSWNAGYVAQFTVTPTGAAVTSWKISWPDAGATAVTNAWGMTCTVGGGRITCAGADWAKNLSAGQTAQVGLQVANKGVAPVNPVITTG